MLLAIKDIIKSLQYEIDNDEFVDVGCASHGEDKSDLLCYHGHPGDS